MRTETDANQALASAAVQRIATKLANEAERAAWAKVLSAPANTRKAIAKARRSSLVSRIFG